MKRHPALSRRRLFCEPLERREVLSATLVDDFLIPYNEGSNRVTDVDSDAQGNIYIAGVAYGPAEGGVVDFDPRHIHNDNHDLVAVDDWSGYVAKYDPTGSLQWVAMTNGYEEATVTPGSLTGDVYVGFTDIASKTARIAKLDSSTGAQLWSNATESARQFAIDEISPSNVRLFAISGQMISGAHYAKINAYSVNTTGLASLWSKGMQPASGSSTGWGSGGSDIAVSPDHASLYITGSFKGNADFDPGSKTFRLSTGSSEFLYRDAGFVWKLTSGGGFVWADAFTLDKYNSSSSATHVRVDPSGNVIVAGGFGGTVDLDPGRGTFKPARVGGADAFFAKLSPAGVLIYARTIGTAYHDSPRDLAVDGSGNIFLSVGITTPTDAPPPKLDSYIAKYSDSGALAWVYSFGGNLDAARLVLDSNNRIHVIGTTNGALYVADTETPKYPIEIQSIFWLTLEEI